MPWIAGAAVIGGSLISGAMSSSGAKKAAKEQTKAAKAAIREEARQFDLTRSDLAPWRDTGSAAINRLAVLLGLTPNSQTAQGFEKMVGARPTLAQFTTAGSPSTTYMDPGGTNVYALPGSDPIVDRAGYDAATAEWERRKAEFENAAPDAGYGDLNKKFTLEDFWSDPVTMASYKQGLDQGTKKLENIGGASGMSKSGAQLKALTRFATDYTGNQAAGSYGRFYGDQDRIYNRLAGVAGTGQTATTSGAAFGQQSANNISQLLTGAGNARGAAAIAGNNAWGGATQNIGNSIANLLNRQALNPQQAQWATSVGNAGGGEAWY